MKHFGIFLAFPPLVDLRSQGLGRYLAMFLKGGEEIPDIRFTIVCPSWNKEALIELFRSERVPLHAFDIISPEGKPFALRIFEALKTYRGRGGRRAEWVVRLAGSAKELSLACLKHLMRRAVQVHNLASAVKFFLQSFIALPIAVVSLLVLGVFYCVRYISVLSQALALRLLSSTSAQIKQAITKFLAYPQNQDWVVQLFDEMQRHEIERMLQKIGELSKVQAWYCPTAFWPEFQSINKPRLLCVPDVVLSDFPVGFSRVNGDRFLSVFKNVEDAIANGERFVTYSENVKWGTLVDRYSVAEGDVSVIRHAPNTLHQYVSVSGFADSEAASLHMCSVWLRQAFQRSTNAIYTSDFRNNRLKFIFYASQFRPNKNILVLLRAFDFLLRKRFIGYKLIMTGNPIHLPEVGDFVRNSGLERDVIFLREISVSELAACYKLADLAVNPTLSEGGCPFTFTEALSVGTPVVMSRIPVAEEVLTDPVLQEMTFFDPYDWRDCAKRIEWALGHREELLATQRKTYAQLSQRTWTDVVNEHIRVLEEISTPDLKDAVV
ncbi:hypothetical protein SAMN04489707_10243 [Paenacidovorax caeni]|uniref:Glycosyl transferase family 1 domain-containing protein n=1 Tax=Paenacidovorax caeni TaxID=343013 RepID=A0A1I7JB34_9BURK|nr:glycosyltransferase [Paenacidovorax caeni]SFU82362.1 hypothetical protein SAMN04489707_10243 [Paenacidovorax caeni]